MTMVVMVMVMMVDVDNNVIKYQIREMIVGCTNFNLCFFFFFSFPSPLTFAYFT